MKGAQSIRALLNTIVYFLLVSACPALAEQREFPTSEPGFLVTYLDAGGVGHATGCVISITAGLPKLAISLSVFSNNRYTVTAASQSKLPGMDVGGSATLRVSAKHVVLRVTGTLPQGQFYGADMTGLENGSVQDVYDVVNQIIYTDAKVDVVADSAQMPSIILPKAPGLGVSLSACQKYMLEQHRD